jgi:hypothetical protein|tara:strand:- start:301 stop:669 length:369 start_codon:yes stop_codon:yes gene_type:complete
MSNYNWCHGPECHTTQTQSRVRGSGDNKVLRTVKINTAILYDYQKGIYEYFCNQRCLMEYISKHLQSIVAIAPRREPLETPVKVVKNKYESHRYRWNGEGGTERVPYMATNTIIKSVDNDNG